MNCLKCDKETKNPKFCSMSCAASFNNNWKPKRSPENKCRVCEKYVKSGINFCSQECKAYYAENKELSTKAKTCPICGILKDDTNSFAPKGNYRQSYCKQCNSKLSAKRARKFKQYCIDYKGGKCEQCDYCKCSGALEFHHTDPSQKDFTIASQTNRTFNDKIKDELDKCLILCANCHREEHYRLSELTNELLGEGLEPSYAVSIT